MSEGQKQFQRVIGEHIRVNVDLNEERVRSTVERYRTDVYYHALVDSMAEAIAWGHVTPGQLHAAVDLAQNIAKERQTNR